MALSPNYLQTCADGIEQIFWSLGTQILMDIAARLKDSEEMTAATEYLNEKLRVLGLQQTAINQMLAVAMNTTEQEVAKLIEESTYKSTRNTFELLKKAGYDTSGLSFRDQILRGTETLNGELRNLTRTTGQLASQKLMNAYDQAYLQVASGAYSFDQALANTIEKVAKEGIGMVEYPSGTRRTIEAAARVAVRTSVNQNALLCESDIIDKMGVNLVETSSHMGARPSHAVWQGKVFWVKDPEDGYENFYEATGYGTPTGLGGYNCRHSFYPYFKELGRQTYEHYDEEQNAKVYQLEQKQRYLERKERFWDREERVLRAGGQNAAKATKWKKYYKAALTKLVADNKTVLKRHYANEKAWTK